MAHVQLSDGARTRRTRPRLTAAAALRAQRHNIAAYSPCPFNEQHWEPADKIEQHVQACPDRVRPRPSGARAPLR